MSLREVFQEMEAHLLQDEKPSDFLERAGRSDIFRQYPLELLRRMKKTKQSPKYHPEGSVWVHTMMVVDEAARLRGHSNNPRAFMWTALLHDIGKPCTTRIRNGKITSYNHDIEGEKLTREFLRVFTEDQGFIEAVCGLVRYHMQILFVAKGTPRTRLEEMKSRVDIREAALFGYCDRMGRTGVDEEKEKEGIRAFLGACGMAEADLEKILTFSMF